MILDADAGNVLGAAAIRRDAREAIRIAGSRWRSCDRRCVPSASTCPHCAGEDLVEEQPASGQLYSFTVVSVGPAMLHRPFAIGFVDLPNGVRVLAHLAGEVLEIDRPVVLDFAEVGTDAEACPIRAVVFRPAAQATS